MKTTLLLVTVMLLTSATYSQMRIIYPDGVKAIVAPTPKFPADASNIIYGNEVRVLVDVDSQGKVKGAVAYGPLVPCSNLSDPVGKAVRDAALDAAKATVFEPILKDGQAVKERVSIGYGLRQTRSPLNEEERRIIHTGVSNAR